MATIEDEAGNWMDFEQLAGLDKSHKYSVEIVPDEDNGDDRFIPACNFGVTVTDNTTHEYVVIAGTLKYEDALPVAEHARRELGSK